MGALKDLEPRTKEILAREETAFAADCRRSGTVFGLNRGIFLSEGGRCCLSVPIGEAEIAKYLGVVEEFLDALAH